MLNYTWWILKLKQAPRVGHYIFILHGNEQKSMDAWTSRDTSKLTKHSNVVYNTFSCNAHKQRELRAKNLKNLWNRPLNEVSVFVGRLFPDSREIVSDMLILLASLFSHAGSVKFCTDIHGDANDSVESDDPLNFRLAPLIFQHFSLSIAVV